MTVAIFVRIKLFFCSSAMGRDKSNGRNRQRNEVGKNQVVGNGARQSRAEQSRADASAAIVNKKRQTHEQGKQADIVQETPLLSFDRATITVGATVAIAVAATSFALADRKATTQERRKTKIKESKPGRRGDGKISPYSFPKLTKGIEVGRVATGIYRNGGLAWQVSKNNQISAERSWAAPPAMDMLLGNSAFFACHDQWLDSVHRARYTAESRYCCLSHPGLYALSRSTEATSRTG